MRLRAQVSSFSGSLSASTPFDVFITMIAPLLLRFSRIVSSKKGSSSKVQVSFYSKAS